MEFDEGRVALGQSLDLLLLGFDFIVEAGDFVIVVIDGVYFAAYQRESKGQKAGFDPMGGAEFLGDHKSTVFYCFCIEGSRSIVFIRGEDDFGHDGFEVEDMRLAEFHFIRKILQVPKRKKRIGQYTLFCLRSTFAYRLSQT